MLFGLSVKKLLALNRTWVKGLDVGVNRLLGKVEVEGLPVIRLKFINVSFVIMFSL